MGFFQVHPAYGALQAQPDVTQFSSCWVAEQQQLTQLYHLVCMNRGASFRIQRSSMHSLEP